MKLRRGKKDEVLFGEGVLGQGIATGFIPEAPAAVAAGWVADPSGRFQLRYWSGVAWTEHVSTNGTQAIDPVPSSAPAAAAVEAGIPFHPSPAVMPAAATVTVPVTAAAPVEAEIPVSGMPGPTMSYEESVKKKAQVQKDVTKSVLPPFRGGPKS